MIKFVLKIVFKVLLALLLISIVFYNFGNLLNILVGAIVSLF